MKKISLILLVFVSLTCYSQSHPGDTLRLAISPAVNQKDSLNQQIISTLKLFLKSKDSSITDNKYWAKSDFEKYIYPYFELQGVEIGRLGRYFYEPSLMEIIPTNGYLWQRNKLKKFLEENPNFQIEEHVGDPFERLYFEHETPVPYVLAALVCERTLRPYGKEKLFDLFRSKENVFDTLKAVGLTKENINDELRKEIRLPPISAFTQAKHS